MPTQRYCDAACAPGVYAFAVPCLYCVTLTSKLRFAQSVARGFAASFSPI